MTTGRWKIVDTKRGRKIEILTDENHPTTSKLHNIYIEEDDTDQALSVIFQRPEELIAAYRSLNKKHLDQPIHLRFHLLRTTADLDIAWEKRMGQIALHAAHAEELRATLSTLGGAYSNLGDHSIEFAKRAYTSAVRQFQIAFQLGDNYQMSKCLLFIALAEAQLGKPKLALKKCRKVLSVALQKHQTGLASMTRGFISKITHFAISSSKQ